MSARTSEADYGRMTKLELLVVVLTRRDAGTINGNLMDMDLLRIAAGCPKGKSPRQYLNGPGKEKVEDLRRASCRADERHGER